MASYEYLNALPPEAFKDPKNFVTEYDTWECNSGLLNLQYAKGLKIGQAAKRVGVGAYGTWYSDNKDGSYSSSYEGIGYHAGTADLWRGFLDSGTEVWVTRLDGTETRIK